MIIGFRKNIYNTVITINRNNRSHSFKRKLAAAVKVKDESFFLQMQVFTTFIADDAEGEFFLYKLLFILPTSNVISG